MKRFISVIVLVATLSLAFTASTLAINGSKSKTVGSYQYVVRTVTTTRKIVPITQTQVEHTKGFPTTISVGKTYTKSVSASSSLTVGVSFYVEMATEIGVSESESCQVDAGVSILIPGEINTGKYRIATYFPGSKVYYETWTLEPRRVEFREITYAPDDEDSYYKLQNYA